MDEELPAQSRIPASISAQEFSDRASRWPRSDAVMTRLRRVLVDGEAVAKVAELDGVNRYSLHKDIKRWLEQSTPKETHDG